MKNKYKLLSLILCFFMIMEVILPAFNIAYATVSDKNTILIACGVTIKDTTTLQEVISEYGAEPKITTTSMFGGTANTFYKEGFEDLLYVETNEKGVVMSAGTCANNFQSNLKDYHEPFDGTVHFMQGYVIDDWDDGAIGVLAYNSALKNSAEQKKYMDKWYNNQYEYEKNLCQHTIPIVNCYLTRDGDSPIEFNEELYDTIVKIEQNGKDLKLYALENGKTDTYKSVGADTGYLATWEALPNPFRAADGASGYRATETKKYGYFRYHIEPKDSNNYIAEIQKYYVSVDLIKKGGEEVKLTQDEEEKLEAAKAMYKKSVDKFNENGNKDYKVEPVCNKVPLVAGKIYENRLIGAVDFINAIRVAAGIPTVKYNATLSNAAQHKSVLVVYVNNFAGYTKEELKNINAHYPPRPDSVSEEFYNTAMSNMSGENLYSGDIISSISNALNDGYGDPITCGHRYNILTPYWTDCGLGEASGQGTHRFSGSQSYENEIVAWPSKGITPMEAYAGGYWTCKLYKNYQVTDNTTVEVKRLNDNKVWNFTERTNSGDNKFQVNGSLLSFYNGDLTGKAGNVYEFTIHNVKNLITNELVDYTYRTVFANIYGTNDEFKMKYPDSVSFEKSEYVIGKGETINLKTIFGGQDVTEVSVKFTCDNENAVSVNQYGNVTGKTLGSANVTVTTLNGKTATCKVRVVIPLKSISIPKTKEVEINKTVKLSVTYNPTDTTEDKTVKWSSSNTKVATVDASGNVKGISGGKATITAKVGEKQATCEVTVKVPITGITLDRESFTMVSGKEATIKATVLPENTTENKKVTWKSSNTNLATVDSNGKVTAKNAGNVTITATTTNGKTVSCNIRIKPEGYYNEFVTKNGNTYYYNDDGVKVTGWQDIGNERYYFDKNGVMLKGITEIDGKKYFLGVTKGKMMKGWLDYNGLTYYMDETTGEMASGVTNINGKSYFFGIKTNKLMKGLIDYNGTLYYANNNGLLQKGMVQVGDKWYYFGNTYKAEGGLKEINKETYYFDPNTKIRAKGITEVNGKKYFFGITKGKMMKGWLDYNGLTYYMDETTGEMASGVTKINNKSYFFGIKTNKLMKGLIDYNGTLYYANNNGLLQKGMVQVGDKWYYFGNSYKAEGGLKEIGGLTYYFDPKTKVRAKGITEVNGKKYFFGITKGKMMKGWLDYNGLTYYMDETTGEMACGVTNINNKSYFFGIKTNKLMKGLIDYNGTLYYANNNGLLQKGMVQVGDKWYYFGNTYKAEGGLKEIGDLTYYFDPKTKVRAKGITEVNGKKYFFGITKGKMMKGWLDYNGLTYYMDETTGEMACGVTKINGKPYFFGIKTNKLMKGLIDYNGIYYANNEGVLQTGKRTINGVTYNFDSKTYKAK